MTPDTAALRAQIRANEDAAAFYGGTPNRIILDPATVRALCDAADEVERLRAAVVERDTRLAETIRYHDARVNRADEATDASRTAHAALIADLRALVGGDELVSQRAVNPDEYTRRTGDRVPSYLAFYQGAADLAAVIRALLDRHAPTLTTTED